MVIEKEQVRTPPFDARFPNQNQTRNCWQNFVDFHRCVKKYSDDPAPCDYFKKTYKSLCPKAWIHSILISFIYLTIVLCLGRKKVFLDIVGYWHRFLQHEKWEGQVESGTFAGKI